MEKNTDQSKAAELAAGLALAELEAEVAEQTVVLRRSELDNAKFAEQVQQANLTFLQENLAWVQRDVVFSNTDLESQLVDIKKQESDLNQELQSSDAALTGLAQQLNNIHQQLNGAATPTPALEEAEKAAKLAHASQTKRKALVQKQLELVGLLRQAWRCRFAIATGAYERSNLAAWEQGNHQGPGTIELRSPVDRTANRRESQGAGRSRPADWQCQGAGCRAEPLAGERTGFVPAVDRSPRGQPRETRRPWSVASEAARRDSAKKPAPLAGRLEPGRLGPRVARLEQRVGAIRRPAGYGRENCLGPGAARAGSVSFAPVHAGLFAPYFGPIRSPCRSSRGLR